MLQPKSIDHFKLNAAREVVRLCSAATVLDLGCGPGRYTRALAADGLRVVGVDAEAHFADLSGDFVRADARCLPFADRRFDLVLAFDLIEHIEDLDRGFAEIRRVMSDRGRLLVSVPNDSLAPRLYFNLTLRPSPARCDPTHLRFLNHGQWRRLFESNFRIERCFGQGFTENGPAWKRRANALAGRMTRFAPNIFFLLAKPGR